MITEIIKVYFSLDDDAESWPVVVALLPRVFAAGHRHTEGLILTGRHAGLVGPAVLHTPVLSHVVENVLETLERLPRAGIVGRTEKPGIAGTPRTRLLHSSLVQTVEHLIPSEITSSVRLSEGREYQSTCSRRCREGETDGCRHAQHRNTSCPRG